MLTAFESSAYINSIAAVVKSCPMEFKQFGAERIFLYKGMLALDPIFVIDSGVLDTTGDLIVNKAWSRSWVLVNQLSLMVMAMELM